MGIWAHCAWEILTEGRGRGRREQRWQDLWQFSENWGYLPGRNEDSAGTEPSLTLWMIFMWENEQIYSGLHWRVKLGMRFFFGGRFQVTTGPSSLMGSTVPMWLDLLRSRFPTGKPQRRGWCWERWWWWTGGSVGLPCRIASVWDSSGKFCQKWDWS